MPCPIPGIRPLRPSLLLALLVLPLAILSLAHLAPAPALAHDGFSFHIVPATPPQGCNPTLPEFSSLRTSVRDLSAPGGPFYHAFVIACLVDVPSVPPNPPRGIGGVEFGVTYPGGYSPTGGLTPISVFDWVSCGDLQFPSDGFPAPGGGTLVTWQNSRCVNSPRQLGTILAVVGYFYLGAYAPANMFITPRPLTGRAKLADCTGFEVDVTNTIPTRLGVAGFGSRYGFNACVTGSPVQKSTWTSLKTATRSQP